MAFGVNKLHFQHVIWQSSVMDLTPKTKKKMVLNLIRMDTDDLF